MRSLKYHGLASIVSDVTSKKADGSMDMSPYTVALDGAFGVCRSNECDGFLDTNSRDQLCTKCSVLVVPAIVKRAERAQDNLDKLISLNELIQDRDIPPLIKKKYSAKKDHWSRLQGKEAVKRLVAALKGLHEYGFKEDFNIRRELALYRTQSFDTPEFREEPLLKEFVSKVAEDGVMGKHMVNFISLYSQGKLNPNAPLAGLLVGFTQHARKMDAGITDNRGIVHLEATFNFFLGLKRWGSKAMEYVSKACMGYALSSKWINRSLNQQTGYLSKIEILDPSEADLRLVSREGYLWFGSPQISLVDVHMDATKVTGRLQFDRRRGLIVGGTVDQGSSAKIPVVSGTKLVDLMKNLTGICEADTVCCVLLCHVCFAPAPNYLLHAFKDYFDLLE